MLTPKGYTNRGQIQNYMLHGIKDYFESQIDDWIAQMEAYVESQTGRVFIADTEASERIYDGDGGLNLFLDECVEITKVTIDGVEVDSGDYLTYPANEFPKTRIKLKNDAGLLFTTEDEQNVKIEAKWGHSVLCPADISFATTVLVVGIINFAGEMPGEVKTEKIGDYQISYKDKSDWQDMETVKAILERYKLITI